MIPLREIHHNGPPRWHLQVFSGMAHGVFARECGRTLIGNDIVDLQYFESPAYRHVGYLEKVCTPAEARAVRESSNPSRSLAFVWASKEAAYKLVSRDAKLRHFVPREFVTDFDRRKSQDSCDELRVSYGPSQIRVTIFETARWVHAIAISSDNNGLHWRVQEIRKPAFLEITPSDESEAVRQLAKELLKECGWKSVSLDFEGKIPTLRQDMLGGKKAISLAHHGGFVAAAIAWSSGNSGEQAETVCSSVIGVSLGEA